MTSFSFATAAAPVLLALVPCVFSNVMKASVTSPPASSLSLVAQSQRHAGRSESERAPWWKPQALGIDNYS